MKLSNWYYERIIHPIGIGLLVYAVIRLVNDSICQIQFWKRPISTTVIEIIDTVIIAVIIGNGIAYFIKRFNQNTVKNARHQIWSEVKIVFLFTAVVINTLGTFMMAVTDNGLQAHDIVLVNVLVTLIILLFFFIKRVDYYLEAYIDAKAKKEALIQQQLKTELKYLKAQINPHFLFNALNNIYHQMDENTEDAKKSLEVFSNMLRYQLYECNQEQVDLEKELTYLQDYIDIQRIRFDESLDFQMEMEPKEIKEKAFKIAPFLLLPLIENAFKYVGGTKKWIQVNGGIKSGELSIGIANSFQKIKQTINQKNSGIGLENLKRRLELLYPNRYQLDIQESDHSFAVDLKIKLHEH